MRTQIWQMPPTLSVAAQREVSEYATENDNEFVAETFTGIVFGRKFSDEIMKHYKALGGPMPNA
jgi:hypothetical protein